METALVHYVVRAIWVLVRVPHFVVDILASLGVVTLGHVCNSNISVRLRHSIHLVDASKVSR